MYNTLWEAAPSQVTHFQKEIIFLEFDFETKVLDFEVRNQASESIQLRVTRVFFLPLLSHNFDNKVSSNIDWYTKWERLVFDNYTCKNSVQCHTRETDFLVQVILQTAISQLFWRVKKCKLQYMYMLNLNKYGNTGIQKRGGDYWEGVWTKVPTKIKEVFLGY